MRTLADAKKAARELLSTDYTDFTDKKGQGAKWKSWQMIENLLTKDPGTYAIIGAAMEVHRQLGCGFLEPVYQQALAVEFELREIPFEREDRIPIHYKGRLLESHYSPDFICFESIVVELKALARLSGTEEAQVINYLKATGCKTGLLLNFGTRSLEHRRFVF